VPPELRSMQCYGCDYIGPPEEFESEDARD
jgi:hypothetical protein